MIEQVTPKKPSKQALLHAALLYESNSNYAVDVHAFNGFAAGLGLNELEAVQYLKQELGDEYPSSIPDSYEFGIRFR